MVNSYYFVFRIIQKIIKYKMRLVLITTFFISQKQLT